MSQTTLQSLVTDQMLLDLVSQYGAPLYVYDGNRIEYQFQTLQRAVGLSELQINFACKSLTNPAILKLIKKCGGGIDAVSEGEVQLALRAGFSPDQIMYTPNGVGIREIEEVRKLGVNLNIDNLEMLALLGKRHPGISLGIRINPHIMAGGNAKISVGHIDSKFGISIHQMDQVQSIVRDLGIHLQGIHMHTGSDILDIDVFMQSADVFFKTASLFEGLEYVDFGSGFKVPYKPGDYYTDIELFGERMRDKFNQFCKGYGSRLKLIFEPGKYLVSSSGRFLVETNVVKHGFTTTFVGVNSGFNHLIRPMFYDSYHTIRNISNPDGEEKYYDVVGYICETDTFASKRKLTEVRVSDILCFENAGAYAFMMASQYNSRPRPAEVLVYKGEPKLIRRAETLDDLYHTLIEIDLD